MDTYKNTSMPSTCFCCYSIKACVTWGRLQTIAGMNWLLKSCVCVCVTQATVNRWGHGNIRLSVLSGFYRTLCASPMPRPNPTSTYWISCIDETSHSQAVIKTTAHTKDKRNSVEKGKARLITTPPRPRASWQGFLSTGFRLGTLFGAWETKRPGTHFGVPIF